LGSVVISITFHDKDKTYSFICQEEEGFCAVLILFMMKRGGNELFETRQPVDRHGSTVDHRDARKERPGCFYARLHEKSVFITYIWDDDHQW
jgi:hypothetical protein